jgi:hypothetical protein
MFYIANINVHIRSDEWNTVQLIVTDQLLYWFIAADYPSGSAHGLSHRR